MVIIINDFFIIKLGNYQYYEDNFYEVIEMAKL